MGDETSTVSLSPIFSFFAVAGVMTYIVGGNAAAKINDSRAFFFLLPVSLLWITVFANVRGLGVGKWVNNIGGIGALVIGGALMLMGALGEACFYVADADDRDTAREESFAMIGCLLSGLVARAEPDPS